MPKQRRRRNSTSSRFISDDDLAVEIFIRLPDSKSEVNCSAVCKRWLSIINSVHFRNKKLQRHQSQSQPQPLPCTFLFRNHGNGDSISLPFYEYFTKESEILHGNDTSSSSSSSSYLDFLPWERVRIHSSFNDLLLLSRRYEYGRYFMICNPFTKQWIELPQPPTPMWASIHKGGAGLFCEPIKPPPPQQQQQHPLKLDMYRYKVMIMCHCCHHENGQVEFCALTYCSEIGKWRESTFSLHQRTLNYNTPVACNGLLYWLVGSTEEETVDGIFAFDPSKLTDHNPSYGQFVNFPSGLLQGKWCSYDINIRLGLVQGRLRLSQLHISKRNGFVLKIWELNYDNNFNYDNSSDDDGSSRVWTLVHDVRVKKWIDKRQHVIAFHPENGNVIFLLFNCRHIHQYDIGEEMMKKVGQFSGDGDEICVGDIRTYTLVHPLWPTPIHAHPSASKS